MEVFTTEIEGVLVFQPEVHRDDRGYFFEAYHRRRYRQAGVETPFAQDNQSRSVRNTIRGLHGRRRRPEGKLVRVLAGAIWDVAVDLRRGSRTFGRWVGVTISADDFRQVWIPPGFVHGFCVTTEEAIVEYKCTELYDPEDEMGVAWNDPQLAIDWPVDDPVISEKDRRLHSLEQVLAIRRE